MFRFTVRDVLWLPTYLVHFAADGAEPLPPVADLPSASCGLH